MGASGHPIAQSLNRTGIQATSTHLSFAKSSSELAAFRQLGAIRIEVTS